MPITLISYIIIIFLAILLGRRNNYHARRSFIVLLSLWFITLTSLKSINVGSDTVKYVEAFSASFNLEWTDLPLKFVERYVLHTDEYDIGFVVIEKTVSSFTHDYHIFTFIYQLFFYVPLGIVLLRFANNFFQLAFAFIFFVSLLFAHALFGGRQLFALSCSMMAFLCVDKNHYFKALAYVTVGTLVHFSSLLFLLYIALCYFFPVLSKKIHYITFFAFPVVLLFVNQVIFFMGNFVGMEKFQKYGEGGVAGGATTFIVLMFLSSLFCYLGIKQKLLDSNKRLQKLYYMLPLLTFFAPLIHSNGSMIRISIYFFVYLMILIPIAIENYFPKKQLKLVYCLFMGLLIMLSLMSGGLVYDFYWNDPVGTWNIEKQ